MGRIRMIILDKPAYRLDEYKEIREANRRFFKVDPEHYIDKQNDWEDLYTISIRETVYVMDDFFNGLRHIRSYYKQPVSKMSSFDLIFKTKHGLPEEVDYMYRRFSNAYKTVTDYISQSCCFTHIMVDEPKQIERRIVHYPVIDGTVPDWLKDKILDIIDNGYSE